MMMPRRGFGRCGRELSGILAGVCGGGAGLLGSALRLFDEECLGLGHRWMMV